MDARSTPEEAARGDLPEDYSRALATSISPDGQYAAVLLGTNAIPFLYSYLVICERTPEGWTEGSGVSGDGAGWHSTTMPDESQPNVGVFTLDGEAPIDAREAVVMWRGKETTIPVAHGYYLFAAWDISESDMREWPTLVRFL